MSSSSNSPCAACKFLRRKCAQGCIFAPYFPPDNPSKFSNVHRVFGASNVAKLLNDLTPGQREDAVNSLSYEAEARLHDPVYGCVGYISLLQHRLLLLQRELSAAKRELSTFVGPAALAGPNNQFYAAAMGMPAAEMGLSLAGQGSPSASTTASMYRDQQSHQHQQQEQLQIMEAQQLIAAAREHEMLRSIEQQHLMARLMGVGNIGVEISATVNAAGAESSPPLALLSPHIAGLESSITSVLQQQQQGGEFQEGSGHHLLHNHHLRRIFDDGRSGVGPSS